MDPVKIEKLQAMRRYKSLQYRFLINLVQYCLSLVCFGLFLSSPLWLPKLLAAVRYLLFVLVPGMGTYLFCPKCFFLLGNAIVIFLVGESKLSGEASSPDIYDEYVQERSKSNRRASQLGCAGKEKDAQVQRPAGEEELKRQEEGEEDDQLEEVVVEEEEEEGDGCREDEDGGYDQCVEEEEDNALPDEELNRRIEDFIARVNKQRRLEARLLDCSG